VRTSPRPPSAGRSDIRDLARNGSINFLGSAGGAFCTLLLLALLARQEGAVATGLFFQAVAVVSTGAIVCNLGASITLMQRIARALAHEDRDLTELAWAALLPVASASIAAGVALAVGHQQLADLITAPSHRHELGLLLLATAPALPLIALTRIAVTASRGTGEMGPAALYDAGGQPLLRLVLCGVVAFIGGPLWALGAAFSAAAALCFVGAWPAAFRSLRRVHAVLRTRPHWRPSTARAFWRFSAPRGLEEIFQATNVWLLVVLVGAMASASQAATYAALSRFTLASTLLMQAISTGMAPRFTAAFARRELKRVRALFRTAVQWTVGLSIPISVTLWIFPSALIALVSPDLVGGTTGLRIMAVATLFSMVTGPSGAAILFAGRSVWNLWIAIAGFTVMFGVAVARIPAHGADGASLAWAASVITQSVLGYLLAKRAFGLHPFSATAARLGAWSASLTVVAEVGARELLGDTPLGLVVGIGVGAVFLLGANTLTDWRLWKTTAVP
jgi:O-antigen/teichoic acid export membrane protein